VASAVVVEWNGHDVPEQLRELPAGRYLLAPVDESIELSPEEEVGLSAALESAETRVLSHDDVMDRARKILAG
jgi:geranylgeranyl pyrophosphate synthase